MKLFSDIERRALHEAQFEAVLALAIPVLVADHGLQAGAYSGPTHWRDIVGSLVCHAPELMGRVAVSLRHGQAEAATEQVRTALAEYKANDPYMFKPAPSKRELADLLGTYLARANALAEADRLGVEEGRRVQHLTLWRQHRGELARRKPFEGVERPMGAVQGGANPDAKFSAWLVPADEKENA